MLGCSPQSTATAGHPPAACCRVTAHYVPVPGQPRPKTVILMKFQVGRGSVARGCMQVVSARALCRCIALLSAISALLLNRRCSTVLALLQNYQAIMQRDKQQ